MEIESIEYVPLYETMVVIREFEEITIRGYRRGELPGLVHASNGQEAVSVGVVSRLRSDDTIVTTHRAHGHCLAKGMSAFQMMAELLGRKSGCCRGKGGSMHLADASRGVIGANGIVAGGIPIAVGAAYSAHAARNGRVCVAFFGEGAMNQGVAYEAMNLASLWKLPVLFVCEANELIEYSRAEELIAGSLVDRAKAFGIPAWAVDGMDVWKVTASVDKALETVRGGLGPVFLEMRTYRFHGHHVADVDRNYRSREEVALQRKRDPLPFTRRRLTEMQLASDAQLAEIESHAREAMEAAYSAALAEEEPSLSTLDEFVFQVS